MTMTRDQQQVNPFGVGVGAPSRAAGSAREVVNEMVEAGLFDVLMDREDRDGLSARGFAGRWSETLAIVRTVGFTYYGVMLVSSCHRNGAGSRSRAVPQPLLINALGEMVEMSEGASVGLYGVIGQ